MKYEKTEIRWTYRVKYRDKDGYRKYYDGGMYKTRKEAQEAADQKRKKLIEDGEEDGIGGKPKS